MLNQLHYPRLPGLLRSLSLLVLLALTAMAFSAWRPAPIVMEIELNKRVASLDEAAEEGASGEFPDFTAYEGVEERKQAFFDYMHEHVERVNRQVLAQREELIPLYEVARDGAPLSRTERRILHAIAEEYRLDPGSMSDRELTSELMLRVDMLPTSLVLAQAANESAWGTSRFARQARNLFGQWCFTEGCGLVPSNRPADASHEVRTFSTVEDAVQAYFLNLNTNDAYDYLRRLRSDMRRREDPINSLVLAYGLTGYSSRGLAYVTELQSIIRYNGLHELDTMDAAQS
ncbi:MAG: glucosaminidase domain-containing protein [Pseudohongiellaceae bacterium]